MSGQNMLKTMTTTNLVDGTSTRKFVAYKYNKKIEGEHVNQKLKLLSKKIRFAVHNLEIRC